MLAASLNCVAATQSAEVRAILEDLSPWMPNLVGCATQDAFLEAVSSHRPDIAVIGPGCTDDDLAALCDSLRTSALGLAVVDRRDGGIARRLADVARATRRIEVEPLDAGAAPMESVLRLRALLRRCRPAALVEKRLVGDMTLDEAALTLTIGERTAPLSVEGFRILAPMFDDPDHVWTREELLALVYGAMTTNGPRTVDVKLNIVRRRLRAALGCDPVRAVRGQGYTIAAAR